LKSNNCELKEEEIAVISDQIVNNEDIPNNSEDIVLENGSEESFTNKTIESDIKIGFSSNEENKSRYCLRKRRPIEYREIDMRNKITPKTKDKIAVCGHNGCNASYESAYRYYTLREHQLRKHIDLFPDIRLFVCDRKKCSFKTKSVTYYNCHLQKHKDRDDGIRKYICNALNCGKRFFFKKDLLSHSLLHEGLKFVCDSINCNKTFPTLNYLNSHKRRHKKPEKHVCDWINCGKKFHKMSELKQHMNTHTGHKSYACEWPGCEVKFMQWSGFHTHMKTHRGEKSFVCLWPECDYATAKKTNFDKHKAKHTGEKRYLCDWPHCDYKTCNKSNLNSHLKQHQRVS
jgi:hypothetical protein